MDTVIRPSRRLPARYGIAVVATVVALLLRWPLSAYLTGASPFIAFTPAILIAARFGGLGPGLLATALSAALGAFFFLEPYDHFPIDDPRDASQMALLLVAGLIISYLGGSTRWGVAQIQKKQQALRESEERFQAVVESVRGYAIIMLDDEGCVMSWNSGAAELSGHRFDEIVGQHFSKLLTPEDVDAGMPHMLMERSRAEGSLRTQGWRMRRDGTRFWASITLSALHRPDGTLRGYLQISRDATDEHVIGEGKGEEGKGDITQY